MEAIRRGAADYLTKPVSIALLRERVSNLIEEARRRHAAGALAQAHGNQSEAARFLRIGRDALRYKMKKQGLAEQDPTASVTS